MMYEVRKNRWQVSKNFITRFEEETNKDNFWNLNKKIGAILIGLLLIVVMVNTSGCTQDNNNSQEDITSLPNASTEEVQQDTVKVGNDGVNAAIAPDDVSVVADQSMSNNGAMVAMSVEDMGRSDPFLPAGDAAVAAAARAKARPKPKPPYASYLMPPPERLSVDTTATAVMTTKVSGIMYDKYNPSAILNISDTDYLVRTGDIVNGYKILSIGRETVTVQYGSNVYKASVGEMFTENGLNFNTISNLNGKFGGNKR